MFVWLVVVVCARVCVCFVPDLIGSGVVVTFVFLSVVVLFVFCLLLFFNYFFVCACVPLPPRRFNLSFV